MTLEQLEKTIRKTFGSEQAESLDEAFHNMMSARLETLLPKNPIKRQKTATPATPEYKVRPTKEMGKAYETDLAKIFAHIEKDSPYKIG